MLRTRILLFTLQVIISLVVLQTNGSQNTEEKRELTYEDFIKILESNDELANLLPKDLELEPEVIYEITTEAEEYNATIKEENYNTADNRNIGLDQINKTHEAEKNTRYNESSGHENLEEIFNGTEKNIVKKIREMDVLDYPLMLSIYMESFFACISDANSTDISSVVSVLSKN